MNATRAQYLLDNLVQHEVRFAFPSPLYKPPFFTGTNKPWLGWTVIDGVTVEEYNFVASIWTMLPNDSSFCDALEVIARG